MSAAPLRWRANRHPWRHWQQTRWGRGHTRLRDKGCLDSQWLALLDAENVQTVVLSRHEDRNLLRLLQRSPQWTVDFADRRSAIFVRQATATMVQ
ncbi:MAG: hypothetical protein JXR84_12545 [Anaerolineae bacterium]|nr:hypothetical protein [Anaerolineae bacterium]